MPGTLRVLSTTQRKQRGRLSALERRVDLLERARQLESQGADTLTAGGLAMAALAPKLFPFKARITGIAGGGISGTAVRVFRNDAGSQVDEDELTDSLAVDAPEGAAFFVGARGWIAAVRLGADPLYEGLWGEWAWGIIAKLTSAPDANYSYTWEQVGVPGYTDGLTNASSGLTRAWDYGQFGFDPDVPPAQRVSLALNTVVVLRWDPLNSRMLFVGAPEPTSGPCA